MHMMHTGVSVWVRLAFFPCASSAHIRAGLWAVVNHHGAQASGGHYTCDVRHPCQEWLRFDDTAVASVPQKEVLRDKLDRSAYLLFYEATAVVTS
jgi:ubiquitin C-terminal hydrolase